MGSIVQKMFAVRFIGCTISTSHDNDVLVSKNCKVEPVWCNGSRDVYLSYVSLLKYSYSSGLLDSRTGVNLGWAGHFSETPLYSGSGVAQRPAL